MPSDRPTIGARAAGLLPFPTGVLAAGLLLLPFGAPAAATPSRAAAAGSASRAAAGPVLPWIEDDLSRALAEARARTLPIFVESWAPW